MDLDKFSSLDLNDAISKIISLNSGLGDFWKKSHGWAPIEVALLLSEARFDRILSFSHRLKDSLRVAPQEEQEAHLINSWVNLGSLIESSLTLFFTVYRNDYLANNARKDSKGAVTDVTRLTFDQLKSLMLEIDFIGQECHDWIQEVQQFRNVIHIFRDKKIGTKAEFEKSIYRYLALIDHINQRLPYPDNAYCPRM